MLELINNITVEIKWCFLICFVPIILDYIIVRIEEKVKGDSFYE